MSSYLPDFADYISFAEHLLRGRYGSWLNQPDEMAACTLDDSCIPLMWASPYELRKCTVGFSRSPGGGAIAQDLAMITFHFLNLTGGNPDASWIGSDYTAAEAKLDTWWNTIKPEYTPDVILSSYAWRADGPDFRPHGTSFAPTLRNTARSLAGTHSGSAGLPPQVAVTVTEVTAAKYLVEDVEGVGTQLRNRWGRFYMPPPAAAHVSAARIDGAFTGLLATATETLYNTSLAADLPIVMYSPTTGNAWSVTEIHVDDIFDVVRSRRWEGPLTRNVKVLT